MNILTVDYRSEKVPGNFTRSLRETGFAVLRNHRIAIDLINSVYVDWQNFFNSAAKHDYLFDNEKQDGYFPLLTENAKGYPVKDLKEFYHIYPWGRIPETIGPDTFIMYDQLVELTSELLSWIQDETPHEVKNLFTEPLPTMIANSKRNLLRVIHYPPLQGNEDPGTVRAAAHEDINLITLLVAGTQPGLEVLDLNGNWHKVSCNLGMIAINCGDMLQEASGGYYPSTTHRVVNPGGHIQNESRYTMPLFLHPRDDVILSERYTAGEYLDRRLTEIGLKS